MSKRLKFQKIALNFVVVIIFIMVAILWFWGLDKRMPVKVFDVSIQPNIVRLGDPLIVKWDVQKMRGCAGRITRQIIDSDGVVWDLYTDNDNTYLEAQDKPKKISKAYILPKGLAVGKAKFKSIILWQCNPITTLRQEVANINFTLTD